MGNSRKWCFCNDDEEEIKKLRWIKVSVFIEKQEPREYLNKIHYIFNMFNEWIETLNVERETQENLLQCNHRTRESMY